MLSFHLGERWDQKDSVHFHCFRIPEMSSFFTAAGFEIEESVERDPSPDVEHQSRRSYIFARKPKASA